MKPFYFLLLLIFYANSVHAVESNQYKSGPIDKSKETFQRWYDEFNQWINEASQGKLPITSLIQ